MNKYLSLLDFIASGFYSGHSKFASGTCGTLVAAILSYLFLILFNPGKFFFLALCIICTVFGIYISKVLLSNNYYSDNNDPSEIVIDEFAGYFVTLSFVELSIFNIIVCFFLFRIFDILKPYPISKIDSMHGAWGIMLDDVLAGVFAGALSLLFCSNIALAQTGGLAIEEFKLASNSINHGKLAFTYERSGTSNIYYIDFSKQKIFPLVINQSKKSCPNWDSNGEKLAYTINNSKTAILDLALNTEKEFKEVTCADWSLDSSKLIGIYKNSLKLVDLKKNKVKTVLNTKKTIKNAKWNPRGDEVIFSTKEFWPGSDLQIADLKNSKVKTITSGYQNFFLASWHPSGGSFVSSYGTKDEVDIWQYTKGQTHPEILFQREGKDLHAIWTEDAELLFFSGEINNKTQQLFYWVKSQSKIFQLTNAKGSIKELSWSAITNK